MKPSAHNRTPKGLPMAPLCCVFLIAVCAALPAVDATFPSQGQTILDQLDKDTTTAKVKAVKALRVQQAVAAKAGDLDLAAGIKTDADELEEQVQPAQSVKSPQNKAALALRARQIVGVYITPSGSAFSLRSGGGYTAGVVGWSPGGSWTVVDDRTVKLVRPDGTAWLFDIDGLNLFNRTDKVTWRKQQ